MNKARPLVLRLDNPPRNLQIHAASNEASERLVTEKPSALQANVEPAETQKPTKENSSEDKNLELATQVVCEIHEKLAGLEKSRCDAVRFIQEFALDLAIAVAGKCIGKTLDENSFPFQETVDRMMAEAGVEPTGEPTKATINRSDYEFLCSSLAIENPDGSHEINWSPTDELPRGSVQLDTKNFSLYFDAELHLREIRRLLMESIHGSQLEKRKNGSSDSSIRRFPDRRTTG